MGGFNIAYAPWPTHWFDFNEDYRPKHVAGFTHARLLDDKLSFLVGARHDHYDHYKIETIARTLGGPLTVVKDGANGTTYSAGAIYYIGPVGVCANYSKNFDPTLDNNVAGRTRTGLVRYTSNVFANYTVSEGALKGFSVGGGAARTGRTYVATIRNEKYYRGEQPTTSLRMGFNTKFRGIPTRLALNVENVLDDRDPMVSTYDGGYRDTSGVAVANGFILRAPRTFRFSTRFTF